MPKPRPQRGLWRRAIFLLLPLFAASCATPNALTGQATSTLTLEAMAVTSLPSWPPPHPALSLASFKESCSRLLLMPPDQPLGGAGMAATLGGEAGDWAAVCSAARAVPPDDDTAALGFFATEFQAYRVGARASTQSFGIGETRNEARVTGYFEPSYPGALERRGPYQSPILARPKDLVTADLGAFNPKWKGEHITGRLKAGQVVPYYDRFQIEHGALNSADLALAWLSNPVDVYLLQIEGMGRITLPGHRVMRVAYAGSNGWPDVPIGQILSKHGVLPPRELNLPTIRAWLEAHPAQAQTLMDQNPSYVFFHTVVSLPSNVGPPGALGVPLSAEASAAVDKEFIPLGAPLFVATTNPIDHTAWDRLVIAQDISGGINTPLAVDVFFGSGRDAEDLAGRMNQAGALYLLLPLAQRVSSVQPLSSP